MQIVTSYTHSIELYRFMVCFVGILREDGSIDNVASIKRLAEISVTYAKAGMLRWSAYRNSSACISLVDCDSLLPVHLLFQVARLSLPQTWWMVGSVLLKLPCQRRGMGTGWPLWATAPSLPPHSMDHSGRLNHNDDIVVWGTQSFQFSLAQDTML